MFVRSPREADSASDRTRQALRLAVQVVHVAPICAEIQALRIGILGQQAGGDGDLIDSALLPRG